MSDSVKTEKVDYSASVPMGPLGIAAVPGCEALVERVDAYLAMWRKDRDNEIRRLQEGFLRDRCGSSPFRVW